MKNQEGMLWFSPDKKQTLEQRIGIAAEYYLKKFSVPPNICYAHPLTATEDGQRVWVDMGRAGVSNGWYVIVRQSQTIQEDNFWLGQIE